MDMETLAKKVRLNEWRSQELLRRLEELNALLREAETVWLRR